MRLGFAARTLGRPGLKAYDGRRWTNSPHLSVSLAYLRDILVYLGDTGIHLYSMASNLAPYITHPDLPDFHRQIDECITELSFVGQAATDAGVRLLFHTGPYVVLNAQDESVAERSANDAVALSRVLEAMGLGPEAVIVTHVGGAYGDVENALCRFVRAFEALPDYTQARIALENDFSRFSATEVSGVCATTGCPMVFDRLHHLLYNPSSVPLPDALEHALGTWPDTVTPLIHFSTPCTAMQAVQKGEGVAERMRRALWSRHADYINPFEFIDFVRRTSPASDFDVVVEARCRDLAVLRLREDVRRFAPDLVRRVS